MCDGTGRILAVGRGVFELTGYTERELMGHQIEEALSLNGDESGPSAIATALEWGVRQLGRKLELKAASGAFKCVTADLFPAYYEDGGLLVALTPT